MTFFPFFIVPKKSNYFLNPVILNASFIVVGIASELMDITDIVLSETSSQIPATTCWLKIKKIS